MFRILCFRKSRNTDPRSAVFLYIWNMEQKSEYELVVSEGKLPIWRAVIAAAFFAMMCYVIYCDCELLYYVGFNEKSGRLVANSLDGVGFWLAGGITFAMTKTVLIDLDNDKLISRFGCGPFYRDRLTKVPSLEYVSVFLDGKERFQVNLWYERNRHYQMYMFDDKEPAMEFALEVAKALKIDLLDATLTNNSQWIDIPQEQS